MSLLCLHTYVHTTAKPMICSSFCMLEDFENGLTDHLRFCIVLLETHVLFLRYRFSSAVREVCEAIVEEKMADIIWDERCKDLSLDFPMRSRNAPRR